MASGPMGTETATAWWLSIGSGTNAGSDGRDSNGHGAGDSASPDGGTTRTSRGNSSAGWRLATSGYRTATDPARSSDTGERSSRGLAGKLASSGGADRCHRALGATFGRTTAKLVNCGKSGLSPAASASEAMAYRLRCAATGAGA